MQSMPWAFGNTIEESVSPFYENQGDNYIGGFQAGWRSRHACRKGWDESDVKNNNFRDFGIFVSKFANLLRHSSTSWQDPSRKVKPAGQSQLCKGKVFIDFIGTRI